MMASKMGQLVLQIDSTATIGIWIAVLALALIGAKQLARRFRKGWARTIGLSPALFLTTYLIGMGVVLFYLAVVGGTQTLGFALSYPADFIAALLLLGLEMMIVPFIITLPFFLWYRAGAAKKELASKRAR